MQGISLGVGNREASKQVMRLTTTTRVQGPNALFTPFLRLYGGCKVKPTNDWATQ